MSPEAKAAGIHGTVEFSVTVGLDGTAQEVPLVRGNSKLVNAAKEVVLKSKWSQATVDGKAVPFVTKVLVAFKLNP
jgi:outer membrane biosynthesis protein TonB